MRQIRNWVDHLSVKKKLVFYGYLTITPVLVVICLVLFFFNYRSGQQEKYASDYASVQTLGEHGDHADRHPGFFYIYQYQ